MAKKGGKAGKVSAAQAARATALREAIRGGSESGGRPGRPLTPREFTDEAARRAWEKAKANRDK